MYRRTTFHVFISYVIMMISACSAQPQQPGYRIEFHISDTTEPVLYMGFYYKGRAYLTDTAYQENVTDFVFRRDTLLLDPGFYFLLNEAKSLLFEFVVGEDQHFKITLPNTREAHKAEVEGDKENEFFFEMARVNAEVFEKARPYLSILRDSTQSKSKQEEAQKEMETIREELRKVSNKLVEERPNLMASKLTRIEQKIDTPEAPKKADGTIDTAFQFRYYREHFFDNLPLSDPLYMRLPPVSAKPVKDQISKKIDTYLDNLHAQQADSLIKAIETLAAMCEGQEKVLEHIIWLCTSKYQNPKIMGLDKILIHLYDTYYATGRMNSFANENFKKEMKKRTDRIRLSLIGNIAPDLRMQNANLQPRSLYELRNKYRVIYFFDPDCHGCSIETPKIKKAQKESKYDIGVFAVCADTSMTKMRDYIKKKSLQQWTVVNGPRMYRISSSSTRGYQELYDAFSTPIIIIIDRKNRIIAKKIPAENIEEFLENHERILAGRAKGETLEAREYDR